MKTGENNRTGNVFRPTKQAQRSTRRGNHPWVFIRKQRQKKVMATPPRHPRSRLDGYAHNTTNGNPATQDGRNTSPKRNPAPATAQPARKYIAVENDSPPFTREELEKIWERFYRREEDRSGRGTGLGLAITRQIVELHGGRCRAENIPGGVRFQLSVPN